MKFLCKMFGCIVKKEDATTIKTTKEETFSVGDEIVFYYSAKRDGAIIGKYGNGVIREIRTTTSYSGDCISYYIDSERYVYDFNLTKEYISHSREKLREKLISMESVVFPISETK